MRRRDVLCALTMLAVACDTNDWDAAEAARAAEPHMESFSKFDAWVRRAVASDPAFPNQEALEETMFAPMRSEDSVVGAWVRWQGANETLAMDERVSLPVDLSWITVRDSDLGGVRVARTRLPQSANMEDTLDAECVIIERTSRAGRNQTVHVTAAYRMQAR